MHKDTYFGMEKKRYETRGIQSRIPIEYRFLLWLLVDELCQEMQADYLQVFQFTYEADGRGGVTQTITHSQEQPDYSMAYEFPMSEMGIEEKVYVIDNGECCTMLLAEEY